MQRTDADSQSPTTPFDDLDGWRDHPKLDGAQAVPELQVRRLTFDSGDSNSARESAAATSVQHAGLPSLLKRLRKDAQDEILRATAHVNEIVHILGREVQEAEGNRETTCTCYEANMAALLNDLRMAEQQRMELVRDKRELECRIGTLVSRNALLMAEIEQVQAEAQRDRERADATEAAAALIDTEELEMMGTGSITINEHEQASRSVSSSVSLANVPTMHGGALSYDATTEGDELERDAEIEQHSGSTSAVAEGRTRAPSASRGSTLFGRQPKVPDSNTSGRQDAGGPSSLSLELGAVRGSLTRKFSFKSGPRLARSLSFGDEASRRSWHDRGRW